MNTLTRVVPETILRAEGNPLMQADPGLAIWTWFVFFMLLAILYKFAWKPILKSLDERENRIQKSIEDAERIEEALKLTNEKNEEVLSQARHEAQKIVQTSREMAEKEKQEIHKQAEREAQGMIEKAKRSIEQERDYALSELRAESVKLSIEIAGKLLGENLNDDKNYQLSKKYMEEMTR